MIEAQRIKNEELEKKVRFIFKIRIFLWICAAAANIYWMVVSFWLYAIGVYEPVEYAAYLRPRLYAGVIISVILVCISFALRHKSDTYKEQIRHSLEDYTEG